MKRHFFAAFAGALPVLLLSAVPLWRQQARLAEMPGKAAAPVRSNHTSQEQWPRPISTASKADTPAQLAEKVADFTAAQCREALDAALASGRKEMLLPLMCRWASIDGSQAFAWLDEHTEIWGDVLPDAACEWAAVDPLACGEWMERAWPQLMPKDRGPATDSPIWRMLLQKDLRTAIRVAGNLCIESPVGAPLSRNDLRPAIRSVGDLEAVGAEILAHPEWLASFDKEKPLWLLVALRECWQEMDPDGWDRWAAAHPEVAEKSDNQPLNPGIEFLRSPDRAAAATKVLAAAPPNELEKYSTELLQLWNDPEATGQWLNAQPDGPVKNAAAQAYALQSAKEEPLAAFHWADAITEPAARARTQRRVFTTWHDADPAAAAAWLPQSGWSDTQQQAARDIMAAAPLRK